MVALSQPALLCLGSMCLCAVWVSVFSSSSWENASKFGVMAWHMASGNLQMTSGKAGPD